MPTVTEMLRLENGKGLAHKFTQCVKRRDTRGALDVQNEVKRRFRTYVRRQPDRALMPLLARMRLERNQPLATIVADEIITRGLTGKATVCRVGIDITHRKARQ